ncbi:TPA: oxaloacetate decarboxylase subunit gamma [Candidatus Gastranaerophilales bacterium HUM_11]|nr:MAG TPA: oxaloacetate decarboxylase subunit gamma [Candidatus Gastranaerophilales bacterium HUM_11]
MNLALLEDGFIVMIIGMGTVFVFLSIMIFAMHLNGKVLQVLNKFFPEEIPVEKKPVQKSDNNEEIALAIACAMAGGK